MIVGQIKDGIVLDHITAGRGMEIYNILGLGELGCTVAMILPSLLFFLLSRLWVVII